MNARVHVFYSGRVQGVGFRFTAEGIAGDLSVTGWVRNLYDGRVEIVAEAKELLLKVFLARVEEYFQNYIRGVDIQQLEPTGEFSDFRIKF
ncbi:MAG: acylphosphatase [Candidatus Omnitrophota bacterium]